MTKKINDGRARKIFALAPRIMKKAGIPGAAIGILHGDKEYYAPLGITSVENPLPVTEDTLFKLASISKTFLATAAVMLVEKGKLNLDVPIKKYLAGFKMRDKLAQETVTMRNLLTHSAGWYGDYFNDFGRGDDALARMVEAMAKIPQVSAPGEIYSYSNTCFNVAARVMEVITGKPYETLIKELLIYPLGLKDSVFFAEEVLLRRFAMGHRKNKTTITAAKPWGRSRCASPTGGIICSVRDLLRYAKFQMGDGRAPGGRRILSARSMALLHEPIRKAFGANSVALSWFVYDAGGKKVLRHGGGTIGQICELHIVPSEGLAVAVLTNSESGAALTDKIVEAALSEYLGFKAAGPKRLKLTRKELAEYAGKYSNPDSKWEIKVTGGGLKLYRTYTGGFPTPKDKPKDQPEPVRIGICEGDKLVFLDGPAKGATAEFMRDPKGRIAWVMNTRALKKAVIKN